MKTVTYLFSHILFVTYHFNSFCLFWMLGCPLNDFLTFLMFISIFSILHCYNQFQCVIWLRRMNEFLITPSLAFQIFPLYKSEVKELDSTCWIHVYNVYSHNPVLSSQCVMRCNYFLIALLCISGYYSAVGGLGLLSPTHPWQNMSFCFK